MNKFFEGFEKQAGSLSCKRVSRVMQGMKKKPENTNYASELFDRWQAKSKAKLVKKKVGRG